MDTYQIVPLVDSAEMEIDIQIAIAKLLAYCRANDWAGEDPYDALNSPIFRTLPFFDNRVSRLVFTQALKRSPVNLRGLLHIPKTQNPKAIALFLSALITLKKVNSACQQSDIDYMIERLRDLRSAATDYWCWGYSFPWQTRTIVVPSGAPNLVCTTFVANALLDAWDHCRDPRCLDMALNAAEYVLNRLYWSEGGAAGFSYPLPSLRGQIHNANFLAAALLCRVYRLTNDEIFLRPALRVVRYSTSKQHTDGFWHYGEAPSQRWIDNFHTGYNLCALHAISRYAATTEFDAVLRRGFEFYRSHFFREDGSVGYFHNRRYPIDAHCVAQSIITLLALKEMNSSNLQLARSVSRWALTHLWDDRGFFYYRVLRFHTNRTSYLRWSQSWMLLAMVMILDASKPDGLDEHDHRFVGDVQSA
jgi:hypothetical protein